MSNYISVNFGSYADFQAYIATIPSTEEIHIMYAPDDAGWVVTRSNDSL